MTWLNFSMLKYQLPPQKYLNSRWFNLCWIGAWRKWFSSLLGFGFLFFGFGLFRGWVFFVCFLIPDARRRKTNPKSNLGSKSCYRARKGLKAAPLHRREWISGLLFAGALPLHKAPLSGAGPGQEGFASSCNSTSPLLSLHRPGTARWQLPPSAQALPANCSLFVPFA